MTVVSADLPPEAIARWLCTAWVRRVIRDPETGHVLDYGRRQRLFNRNQRRAMAHRRRAAYLARG